MKKYGAQNMFSDLKKVLINPPLKGMNTLDYNKWHYNCLLYTSPSPRDRG